MSGFLNDIDTLHTIYATATDHGGKWKFTRDEIKDMSVQTVMAQAWMDADLDTPQEPLATHENDEAFERRVFG